MKPTIEVRWDGEGTFTPTSHEYKTIRDTVNKARSLNGDRVSPSAKLTWEEPNLFRFGPFRAPPYFIYMRYTDPFTIAILEARFKKAKADLDASILRITQGTP